MNFQHALGLAHGAIALLASFFAVGLCVFFPEAILFRAYQLGQEPSGIAAAASGARKTRWLAGAVILAAIWWPS